MLSALESSKTSGAVSTPFGQLMGVPDEEQSSTTAVRWLILRGVGPGLWLIAKDENYYLDEMARQIESARQYVENPTKAPLLAEVVEDTAPWYAVLTRIITPVFLEANRQGSRHPRANKLRASGAGCTGLPPGDRPTARFCSADRSEAGLGPA